jgi:uncharacterized membrane protein YfcA
MLHSPWLYPLLFITGLVAGCVDSIAGGGGLITLPILLGVGIPPTLALGTNKLQSSFGSFTASHHFVSKKVVSMRDARLGIAFTLIGAALGTWTVQQISSGVLGYIIPIMLAAIIVYSFFAPKFGEIDVHPKFNRTTFYVIFGLALGFYDGFFGPGVGSFWTILLIVGLGMNILKATGYTKVMNFTSNIVALTLFAIGGNVWVAIGACMAAGQIIGARFGSWLVIHKGAKFVRPVFLTMVILTTLKLIYSRFF